MPITLRKVGVLIPAYRPSDRLIALVAALSEAGFLTIAVVDDGSGPDYARLFSAVKAITNVTLLRHAVNLGKGAALKTGMNHILCAWPEAAGIVTADADGQHHPDDICKVAACLVANSGCLVLGARQFHHNVPLRSRIGNNVTRRLFALLVGRSLADTQTGLRGIPLAMVPYLLRLNSAGYEFELDMLLLTKHRSFPIREVTVQTIYIDGNVSSHFNPILDSVRVYFVLLRAVGASLLTAVVDNAVFFLVFVQTASLAKSQIIGRLVAVIFNYAMSYKAVFISKEAHTQAAPRYLLLVCASGIVAYGFIRLLSESFGLQVLYAKIVAESVLFLANFAILRDFVFSTSRSAVAPGEDHDDAFLTSTVPLTQNSAMRGVMSALHRFRRFFSR